MGIPTVHDFRNHPWIMKRCAVKVGSETYSKPAPGGGSLHGPTLSKEQVAVRAHGTRVHATRLADVREGARPRRQGRGPDGQEEPQRPHPRGRVGHHAVAPPDLGPE